MRSYFLTTAVLLLSISSRHGHALQGRSLREVQALLPVTENSDPLGRGREIPAAFRASLLGEGMVRSF